MYICVCIYIYIYIYIFIHIHIYIYIILQAIKQMYVLVLGLDVLGNPFGLLRGLSEGAVDLFYEPYQVCTVNKFKTYFNNMHFQCTFVTLWDLGNFYLPWSFGHARSRAQPFSFQPVLHDWCNKGRGMCYPRGGAYKRTLAGNRKV